MRPPSRSTLYAALLAASLVALPSSAAFAKKVKKAFAPAAETKETEEPKKDEPEPEPKKNEPEPRKPAPKKRATKAPTAAAGSSVAAAQRWVIGIGVQLHSDDISVATEERIGPTRRDDRPIDELEEYDSIGALSGSIWALRAINGWARAGGGLRYYGEYGLEERLEEDAEEDAEARTYDLGRLFEVYTTVEAIVPVSRSLGLDATIGLDAGISVLTVGGDLADEVERAENSGAGVNSLPRPGVLVGPRIGLLYALWSDRLAARLDLAGRYGRSYLFATTDEIGGVAYAKEWTLSRVRYEASFGLELAL